MTWKEVNLYWDLCNGNLTLVLTHQMPVLPLYRNQSINLHSNSIEWFLYKGSTGIWWVKSFFVFGPMVKGKGAMKYFLSICPFFWVFSSEFFDLFLVISLSPQLKLDEAELLGKKCSWVFGQQGPKWVHLT